MVDDYCLKIFVFFMQPHEINDFLFNHANFYHVFNYQFALHLRICAAKFKYDFKEWEVFIRDE